MGISRRRFLSGVGLGTMGVALGGLSACAPAQPSEASNGSQTSAGGDKPIWETPPEPISESEISETYEADIVIVGAGISGNTAALTAAEAGASVLVLQKHSDVLTNGNAVASLNSKVATAAGVEIDPDDLFNTWRVWGENRMDRKMFNLWRDYSGEAFDWLCEHLSETGLPLVPDPPVSPEELRSRPFAEQNYPDAVLIPVGGLQVAMKTVQEHAEKAGVQYFWSTPAVQLIRGDDNKSGRVTGVIGKDANGKYIKFNGTKAVILCAGDYANNMEMRAHWTPHLADLTSPYAPAVNTGDGDLMGMWVGAAMDLGPHCSTIHYDLSTESKSEPFCGSGGAPWLRVNTLGERFSNEDTAYHQVYAQDIWQPGHMHYDIFDARHPEEWPQFAGGVFRGVTGPSPEDSRPVWEDVLKQAGQDPAQYDNIYDLVVEAGVVQGVIEKADTLEELASKIEVDPKTFQATVERYNTMVDAGKDEDFGKDERFLFPVRTAPYYAIPRVARVLAILNGLTVNTSFQVLDEDGDAIEGLYAAGNNSGGNYFGGLVQPMCAPAFTIGRALLTGRLAARSVLGIDY